MIEMTDEWIDGNMKSGLKHLANGFDKFNAVAFEWSSGRRCEKL